MSEDFKDFEKEGTMANEPLLAEMPLTELKEVDYQFGNRGLLFIRYHTQKFQRSNTEKRIIVVQLS